MRVALITSCTNRKKVSPSPALEARNLPKGALSSLATEWMRRVAAEGKRVHARDLYAGRAFTEALAAAGAGQGGCYVVSAGLGLISIDDEVPAYSLTVAGSDADNVLKRAIGDVPRTTEWWNLLTTAQGQSRPLSSLIRQERERLFVLALPSSYLALVADDIGSLSVSEIDRMRVIGLPSLRKLVPRSLLNSFVPYDERFEAAESGHAGTRSDFPQRAARHFISAIVPRAPMGSVEEHAKLVESFLEAFARPVLPDRARHSDEMLKDVIRSMWEESHGRVTNALRILRRERKIACEQSRFKRLFWEVSAEKDKRQ